MSDITTLTGIVATVPKHFVTTSGVAVTTFRLASGQRRFDRSKNAWVDADTNWYSVSTFRHLAFNVATSLNKGEHIVVTGRLRVRDWTSDERKGTSIEIEADALGHDLLWCTTSAVRSAPSAAAASARAQEQSEQFGQLEPPEPPEPQSEQSDPFRPVQPGHFGQSVQAEPEGADLYAVSDPYAAPVSQEPSSDGFLPVQPPAFSTPA
jgi:single-strand DNA-binding protein